MSASPLTWESEVSACRLVGDPVVDDVEMFLESLSQRAVSLGDKLLLALGAGDEVDQVAGLAVHATVDLDRLTRHCGLTGGERVDVLTHVTVSLLTLHKPGRTVCHLQEQQQLHNSTTNTFTTSTTSTTTTTTFTTNHAHHRLHPQPRYRPTTTTFTTIAAVTPIAPVTPTVHWITVGTEPMVTITILGHLKININKVS